MHLLTQILVFSDCAQIALQRTNTFSFFVLHNQTFSLSPKSSICHYLVTHAVRSQTKSIWLLKSSYSRIVPKLAYNVQTSFPYSLSTMQDFGLSENVWLCLTKKKNSFVHCRQFGHNPRIREFE